jgi:hypothetical protein
VDEDAVRAIENFARSGTRYLLATSFTAREVNLDIALGDRRPLNLRLSPFDLQPVLEIDERCPPDREDYLDKRLGLWRLVSSTRGVGSE